MTRELNYFQTRNHCLQCALISSAHSCDLSEEWKIIRPSYILFKTSWNFFTSLPATKRCFHQVLWFTFILHHHHSTFGLQNCTLSSVYGYVGVTLPLNAHPEMFLRHTRTIYGCLAAGYVLYVFSVERINHLPRPMVPQGHTSGSATWGFTSVCFTDPASITYR